ncbi:MarR family winged helix-turn-helix transcriptional regulator [Kitasatospora sp. NPDC059648]|uniref:MarR family winged helix-turn-helix transcriptional regulator n=1 Tax=Kitasatospora sp. NPDC059648 TaxID=3346894 RepID=UPI003693A44E
MNARNAPRAQAQGLVVREPGEAAGYGPRAVLVSLTAAGHQLVEQSVDVVLGREARLVGGLSQAERETLVGLLDKLLADVRRQMAGQEGAGEDRGDRTDP